MLYSRRYVLFPGILICVCFRIGWSKTTSMSVRLHSIIRWMLVDAGLVVRHQITVQSVQYELRIYADTHLHLVCTRCGAIRELRNSTLKADMRNLKVSRFTPEYCARSSRAEGLGASPRCVHDGGTGRPQHQCTRTAPRMSVRPDVGRH